MTNLDEKYWRGYPTPEHEIVELTGYSVRQLYYLRKGRKIGNRDYRPVLIEGRDWKKLGGTTVYSERGKALLLRRRGKGSTRVSLKARIHQKTRR